MSFVVLVVVLVVVVVVVVFGFLRFVFPFFALALNIPMRRLFAAGVPSKAAANSIAFSRSAQKTVSFADEKTFFSPPPPPPPPSPHPSPHDFLRNDEKQLFAYAFLYSIIVVGKVTIPLRNYVIRR